MAETTTASLTRALQRPFPAGQISWRVGAVTPKQSPTKGVALAYIDARDVMRRLDDVFGLHWQARYSHADRKTICEIGVKIDGEWVWRSGGAGDTDIEAEKGAISDAFKRAAVLWGVGRYLYEIPNEWMPLDDSGKRLKTTPALPKWATPEGFDEIMAARDAGKPEPKEPAVVAHSGPAIAFSQLAPDWQAFIMDWARDIGNVFEQQGPKAALDLINDTMEKEQLDPNHYAAMWSKLDSKTRASLKAAKPVDRAEAWKAGMPAEKVAT